MLYSLHSVCHTYKNVEPSNNLINNVERLSKSLRNPASFLSIELGNKSDCNIETKNNTVESYSFTNESYSFLIICFNKFKSYSNNQMLGSERETVKYQNVV